MPPQTAQLQLCALLLAALKRTDICSDSYAMAVKNLDEARTSDLGLAISGLMRVGIPKDPRSKDKRTRRRLQSRMALASLGTVGIRVGYFKCSSKLNPARPHENLASPQP